MMTFDRLESVVALKAHYDKLTSKVHLRELLQDKERNKSLLVKLADGSCILDLTHTKIDKQGLDLLYKVGEEV
jgi:hypothetical protein